MAKLTKKQKIAAEKIEDGKFYAPYDACALVKEISSQMGFPNEHYFSVLFKRKSGMTPNEYRKRKISGE